MTKYKVEVVAGDDGQGHQDWVLASRRQLPGTARQMDHGAAEFLNEHEADYLIDLLNGTSEVRRVEHESIAAIGTGDARIAVYQLSTGDLVAATNGDPVYAQDEEWQALPSELRAQAEANRAR